MTGGMIHAIALAGRLASKQGTLTHLLSDAKGRNKQTDSSRKNRGEGLFDICASPLRNVASAKPAGNSPV